jgi:hypothetical protein
MTFGRLGHSRSPVLSGVAARSECAHALFLLRYDHYAEDVSGFVLAYAIVQTAGLVVLIWLSLR